jgi:hypothetical protein
MHPRKSTHVPNAPQENQPKCQMHPQQKPFKCQMHPTPNH